jgi:hypothetical protein
MIYKRGKTYWYKFMWHGKLVRESTKQGNDKVARTMESAHRTSLAKGEVGIREPKTIPTLKEFCKARVEPWAKSTFEKTTPKSWLWYRTGIRALTNYRRLGDAHLDEIMGELASDFAEARRPEEGWVWTAATRSGHVEPSSLRKQHARTFETIASQAKENNLKPVRPFVLYSLRHTFLTRLGESGCDAWTLARIAGHASINISARYVHPSEDAALEAISRLGGHKIGHKEESTVPAERAQRQLTQ